ncbi:hypothetical protein [Streptomyces hawaiiensis]|uniref:hypothetical protein n=1 Tax=Streptomyces hawaiiensis TaxID=67305 RepID=UPI003667BF47
MRTRGRGLRFTAVLVLVVLALTGFSSGRGPRRRLVHPQAEPRLHAHPSSSGSSGGKALKDGAAKLIGCATPAAP